MAGKGSELEEMIDVLEEDAADFLKEYADSIKPLDMTLVAKKDALFDFQTRMMNPEYLPGLFVSAVSEASTSGEYLDDGLLAFMEHIDKMQELANA